MTRIAYVDMVGGAAGDMLIAALVDAGADPAAIERALRTIAPEGWTLGFERTQRRGISALRCLLDVPGEDLADGAFVFPPSRTLSDVLTTIDRSGLTARQKSRAGAVYRRLAEAEASVHGESVDTVHFHEVGALDAILDIAGVCVALDLLEIGELACGAFPVGTGRIRMHHGTYPNPPPATAHMLIGSPVEVLDVESELVTPTAAAILTTFVRTPGRRPPMTSTSIGYGAGTRDHTVPNVVRVTLGTDAASGPEPQSISVLEANIDDMSPQHYALAMERIFAAGARDVWMTPVTMKKQRPAIVLSAIARAEDEAAVAAAMLAETTTIGVRVRTERKYALERRIETIDTPLGRLRVKFAGTGATARVLPEHDDVVRIARERSLPLPEVAKLLQRYASDALRGA